jgi:hypothetical protein
MDNILAKERRHSLDGNCPVPDYRALHCKADEMVFLAFALLVGPICVVDTISSTNRAVLYTAPAKRTGCVTFVLLVPEHFQQLVGPSTTCDQLCSVAGQAAPPPRPAAVLAPRRVPARSAAERPIPAEAGAATAGGKF